MPRFKHNIEFLEEGNIFFFYQPKAGITEVESATGMEGFYIILDPYDQPIQRLINVMGVGMPALEDGTERSWAVIEQVGKKFQVGRSRPAGEGVYALAMHGGHVHLVYSLELPARVGIVQKQLHITRQGNYILIAFHPDEKKYVPARPDMISHEGVSILLIGVGKEVSRLGISVEKERETASSADIFSQLSIDPVHSPVDPLLKGKWR